MSDQKEIDALLAGGELKSGYDPVFGMATEIGPVMFGRDIVNTPEEIAALKKAFAPTLNSMVNGVGDREPVGIIPD